MRKYIITLFVFLISALKMNALIPENTFQVNGFDDLAFRIVEAVDGHNIRGVEVFASSEVSGNFEIPRQIEFNGEALEVVGIGEQGFQNSAITSINLPSSITYLGRYSLDGSKISEINLPENLLCIEEYALAWLSVTEIVLPNSVKELGDCVFDGCENLKNITLSHSLKEIPLGCFWRCSSLETIYIPNNVEYWENNATEKCYNLKTIIFEDGSTPLTIGQRMRSTLYSAFSKDVTAEVYFGRPITNYFSSGLGSKISKITCGPYFSEIPDNFAKYCVGLQSFTSEYEISKIGNYSFSGCSQLETFQIHNPTFSTIGSFCFFGCSQLNNFEIPFSVTIIESGAFNGCSSLRSIVALPTTPPSFEPENTNSEFEGVDKEICILEVPESSFSLYANAEVWKDFLKIQTSGISERKIDNSMNDRTYYDLYGREVQNPQNGLYIQRKGKITSKVFIP